ncbi:hypothetical protein B0H14DRAFT_3856278 [Mycena olivaceomarginata]|nr:hypothetical protein B0H14DRAFT_3856278 [Mycena olivaceomarginata]
MDHSSVYDLAVILTCERTDSNEHFVEMTSLNLKTWVSDLKLASRVPETPFGHAHIRLHFDLIDDSQIAVIPGYLLVTLAAMHGEHRLAFSPFAWSIALWEPNDSTEPPSARQIYLPAAKPPTADQGPRESAAPRTLQNMDPYLAQRRSSSVQLRMRSYTQYWGVLASSGSLLPIQIQPTGMTLSGYTLGYCAEYDNRLRVFPPDTSDKESALRQIVEFPGRAPFVYLSAFSGALTYSTDKELVVYYD